MQSAEIGLSLLIILILVKDVVIPLIKGDPMKEVVTLLRKITEDWRSNQTKIDDLHDWHKPDHTGQQTWKNNQVCRETSASIGRLFSIVNDGFGDIKAALERWKQ